MMADNRLWLVHRPSRRAILLAKRISEWYPIVEEEKFQRFFDSTTGIDADDFELVIEDASLAPALSDKFKYIQDDEFMRIVPL